MTEQKEFIEVMKNFIDENKFILCTGGMVKYKCSNSNQFHRIYDYLEKDRNFNVFRIEYVLDDDMGEKIKTKIRLLNSYGEQYDYYYENEYIIGFEYR